MIDARELANRQIAEVRALMASGRIPVTARNFSELHDYIDANCLGGADTLCDCDGPEWEQWMLVNEEAQGIVDEWLKERDNRPTVCLVIDRAIDGIRLTEHELAPAQMASLEAMEDAGRCPVDCGVMDVETDEDDPREVSRGDMAAARVAVDQWLKARHGDGFPWTRTQIAILADAVDALADTLTDYDEPGKNPVAAIVVAMTKALSNAHCAE